MSPSYTVKMQKRKRQTITRTILEKKYLFKHLYSQTQLNTPVQESLTEVDKANNGNNRNINGSSKGNGVGAAVALETTRKGGVQTHTLVEEVFETELERLANTITKLKTASRFKWFKIIYSTPGKPMGFQSKNILTFEGKCIKIKKNGLHTKLILENPLNIIQQFCIYASNILEVSYQTNSGVEIIIYSHPQFKKR